MSADALAICTVQEMFQALCEVAALNPDPGSEGPPPRAALC